MAIERHTISELARDELEGLRARGVEPTDAEIVEIHGLCQDVLSPPLKMAMARGEPIECGGAWLYPLTFAAADWFARVGCNMRDAQGALAYAMADGHSEKIEQTTERDVRRWKRKLHATKQQLTIATAFCLAQSEEPETPQPPTDAAKNNASLATVIVTAIGGDPLMWERRVSYVYCAAVLGAIGAQFVKEGSVDETTKQATMALGMAVERMVRERQGETEGVDNG
jgi:hypothetical protein